MLFKYDPDGSNDPYMRNASSGVDKEANWPSAAVRWGSMRYSPPDRSKPGIILHPNPRKKVLS
jgi:hypothetical protein